VLLPFSLFAQFSTVKGKIVDSVDHTNVPFTTVFITSLQDSSFIKSGLTDSTGKFELLNLPSGNYFLTMTSIGYKSLKKSIFLNTPIYDTGEIKLNRSANNLNTVIIKEIKPPFIRKLDRVTINVNNNNFFKTTSNVVDILKRSPGVVVERNGQINLRNNTPATILINGKPIQMSIEELNNYLSSLNTNMIESIDLIESPSAKYDSEYKAVIDIKLKINKSLGLSGIASSYGQVDAYGRWGGNFFAKYQTKSMTYFANYSYNNIKTLYKSNTRQLLEDDTRQIEIITKNEGTGITNNYQFGADYALNKNNIISVSMKGYKAQGTNPYETSSLETKKPFIPENEGKIFTTNYQTSHPENYSFTASYIGQFKSGILSFDAYYINQKSLQTQNIINTATNVLTEFQKTNNNGNIRNKVIALDYEFNIGKGKLDIGSKLSNTSNISNQLGDTLNNGSWIINPRYTNNFLYQETVLAGFTNYIFKIRNSIDVQAGLRIENTNTTGNSITIDQIVKRNYLSWLPSINIGIQLNEIDKLTLSYTKKLTRPPFLSLNPFRLYISPFSFSEGNPFLLPAKVDLANISYSHNNLIFTLSAKHQKDILAQIPYVDSTTRITNYKQTNIGSESSATIDGDYVFSINSWWKIQSYASMILRSQQFPYESDFYHKNNLSFSLSGTQSFNISPSCAINLSYNYDSANNNLIYYTSSNYSIDIGIQKSFFEKRLDLKISSTDILYTSNPKMKINVKNYYSEIFQQYNSRMLKFQLTYSFGNAKNSRRSQSNIHSEEDRRL